MTDQPTTTTEAPAVYRYAVRYYVVDDFGSPLWEGRATITQDKPRPADKKAQALLDVQTVAALEASAPADMPAGRFLIAAVRPIN